MRDEFLKILGVIVLGLVIIAGTLACFEMLSISPLWGDGGAAWVQAVGSIAALGVAIFVMSHQNKNAVRLIYYADELQVKRRARVAGIIFRDLRGPAEYFAYSLIEDYHAADAEEASDLIAARRHALSCQIDTLSVDQTWYHDPLTMINNIPIYEIGSERLVDIIFIFRNGLKRFAAALNSAGNDPEGFDPKTLHDAAAQWLDVSAQAKENFEAEFARRYGENLHSEG